MARLRERGDEVPNPVLLVAGDGPQRASVLAEVRRQGLDRSVRLLGHVPVGRPS